METNNALVAVALGRIFRMGSRAEQPGDVAEYERCRAIILNELDPRMVTGMDYQPNYARDRHMGASGD